MNFTKTQKYLFPALYFGYDEEFKQFLAKIGGIDGNPRIRINSYIGDFDRKKVKREKCIFILLKVGGNFEEVLNTFRRHESYSEDYAVGDFNSNYHMVVCQINNERAYNYFMISRYSKMYTEAVLEKEFYKKTNEKTKEREYISTYDVLNKTEKKRKEIIELNGLDEDFNTLEYEGVLNMFEEIFDYEKMIK